MSRVALILNGLVMTMIGVRALFTPEAFMGGFDVELGSAKAFAEARSIHGGGFAALAILMWLGLAKPAYRISALHAAAFLMFGLAGGRLVGIVANGATDSNTIVATVVELVLGGLAAAALLREGSPTSRADA